MALQQVVQMKEASQPQQESALEHHKWYSNHIDEEWISNIDIGLHQAYNWIHIAIKERIIAQKKGAYNWNLMTILCSKIAKVSLNVHEHFIPY